eukprot:scaffold1194_cov369-Prasinococcus_capsulatus_cf.AAC.20
MAQCVPTFGSVDSLVCHYRFPDVEAKQCWGAGKNYLPGDKIMLFGFSRGAYTVRALNGMIAQVGLLKPEYATEQKVKEAAALYSEKRVVKVTRVANALKNAKDDTGGSRFPNLQWGPREILSFAATAFLSRDANEKVVKNVRNGIKGLLCAFASYS